MGQARVAVSRSVGAALLAVATSLAAAPATVAAPPSAAVVLVGDTPSDAASTHDCLQAVPDEAALRARATDAGSRVRLDVVILLDGVRADFARRVMAGVAAVYQPLGIELAVRYRTVRLAGPLSTPGFSAEHIGALIDQARALYRGRRPPGVDVVHVISAKRYGGGMADCIGGIRYPTHGFSAAQATLGGRNLLNPLPATTVQEATVTLHAHELGHTLGAHHHYANCVEGVSTSDVTRSETSPCTLMGTTPAVSSPVFDLVNAAIVRGHSLAYAR